MNCPKCFMPLSLDDLCRRFTPDGQESEIIYFCRTCRSHGAHWEWGKLEAAS